MDGKLTPREEHGVMHCVNATTDSVTALESPRVACEPAGEIMRLLFQQHPKCLTVQNVYIFFFRKSQTDICSVLKWICHKKTLLKKDLCR